MDKQIYLGDGVYAAFDADRSELLIDNRGESIRVNRRVWDNLREYAQQVWVPKRPAGGSAIER